MKSTDICYMHRCLISGTFPDIWKEPILLPKVEKAVLTGSKPTSILPLPSKLFQNIIFNTMLKYFIKNGLITSANHASRPGHSTSTALVHDLQKDDVKVAGAVPLYFTAAFDVIDRSYRIAKFKCFGFHL